MAGGGAEWGPEATGGGKSKGVQTPAGCIHGKAGGLKTTPGLLAKLPPSAEGSVTRPHHIPTLGHCLHHPPPPARGLASAPFAEGGRSSLSVPLALRTRRFGVKEALCARMPPCKSRAHLCLRHLLLFTVMSYLVCYLQMLVSRLVKNLPNRRGRSL